MRLLSFRVEGFKNFTSAVSLDDLGVINLLHGDNNVGKSNLLQALELFFVALKQITSGWLPVITPQEIGWDVFTAEGFPPREIFNYARPFPIRMSVRLAIDKAELDRHGIRQLLDTKDLTISIQLERADDRVSMLVQSFKFGDGTETIGEQQSAERKTFVMRFAKFLTTEFLGRNRFTRLGIERRLDEVVNALYDSQASEDRGEAMQWQRFEKSMEKFQDVLGPGRFVPVLPRGEERARLLFENPTMRVPVEALGTGVQQVVALVGGILTAGASIVFVEEPEAHLRWSRQEQLHELLEDLVGKEGAPSQIILSSHSAAFETRKTFYLMQSGEAGPTIEIRPVTELGALVGPGASTIDGHDIVAPVIPTYATSDGVLKVPPRIRKALGVESGGGVSFVDKGGGVVEMMSDDTFLRLAGLDQETDVAP